ncbi:MAG: DMT family transporter [Candidatus Dadabacteria bacterium]
MKLNFKPYALLQTMPVKKTLSWIIFIFLSCTWGSSFILMKEGAEYLTGWQIAAVRIFSAGLFFWPFAVFHFQSIPVNKIPFVILTGMLGNFLPAFLFAIAIDANGESSIASILNSLTPLFVVLIGSLFFKVSIPNKKLIGVLVGFVGVVVLSVSKEAISFKDIGFTLLILIATIFYGLNVNIISVYLKGIDSFKIATVSLALMSIPAAFIVWRLKVVPLALHDKGVQFSVAMSALLGVLGSSISTALYYVLIRKAGGLFASLVTYAIPIVAIGWGLWAHESVGPLQIASLGIILCGVYLANR